jgi:hypothetical protein
MRTGRIITKIWNKLEMAVVYFKAGRGTTNFCFLSYGVRRHVVKASPFTAGSCSPNNSQLRERVKIPIRISCWVWANVTNAGWAVHWIFNDTASITDVILMYNYDWLITFGKFYRTEAWPDIHLGRLRKITVRIIGFPAETPIMHLSKTIQKNCRFTQLPRSPKGDQNFLVKYCSNESVHWVWVRTSL